MSVYSMTGFGQASAQSPSVTVDVEIRSVNSRFMDPTLKLSEDLRGLEAWIRQELARGFSRGKIEVRAGLQRVRAHSPAPDLSALTTVIALERSVLAAAHAAQGLTVHELLQWCERLGAGSDAPQAAPADIEALFKQAFAQAIKATQLAQSREGDKLKAALQHRVQALSALAEQAAPLIPVAVEAQRRRFLARFESAYREGLAQVAEPSDGSLDRSMPASAQERALAEAVSYALRIDVAEELSRLNAHLSEIDHLLQTGGDLGKRLEFLIQELHRECNTLGSKSTSIDLTRISVEMKVLVEQMREQVQNIA